MMNPAEKAVRDAATALRVAIEGAEAKGFRVDLPRRAKDLDAIAISATGRVVLDAAKGERVTITKPTRSTKKS